MGTHCSEKLTGKRFLQSYKLFEEPLMFINLVWDVDISREGERRSFVVFCDRQTLHIVASHTHAVSNSKQGTGARTGTGEGRGGRVEGSGGGLLDGGDSFSIAEKRLGFRTKNRRQRKRTDFLRVIFLTSSEFFLSIILAGN